MAGPTPKAEVAALIDMWVRRSGLQKQQVAARAGFDDYNEFYRAYLDQSRALSSDPRGAIGVVQAFSERLTDAERCSAEEAVRFLILTSLPLDGFERVWRRGLFPPGEWRAAVAAQLSFQAADPGAAPPIPDPRAILERIEQQLAASPPPTAGDGDALAAAAALLATMPAGPGAPLPDPAPLQARHRVPFARNTLFEGRDAELSAIAALLKDRPSATGHAVALTGLGGVGKTSLAVEFVHRYGQFFAGGVFWLGCADAHQLPAEAVACGAALLGGAGWPELPLDEQLRRVRAALAEPVPRLLVLDNCEDEATLAAWRPVTGGCRVLLTSRRSLWPASLGVRALALSELSRAAGVALLRRYRPDLPPGTPALDALCALLGDLPLALHLAGSYLESYSHEPELGAHERLLAALRAADLLSHDALLGVDVAPTATGHELQVGQTFAVSFERLDPAAPADALARAFLARAGWLAPNSAFRRELLALGGPAAPDDRLAARAVRRLRDLGLLSDQGGGLYIHPLVAAFARRVGGLVARDELEAALVERAGERYLLHDVPAVRELLPHLRLRADELGQRVDDQGVLLCNHLALIAELAFGDAAGSLPYLERAGAMLASRGALETAVGATVMNNLGTWQQVLGDTAAARRWLAESLRIREQVLSPDDPELAQSYNNMAELLRELGELEAAEQHFTRALAILEAAGAGGGVALATRNNLALLVRDQGRYAEAAAMFRELLASVELHLGSDDPRTVRTRHNLGDALRRAGDLPGARTQLQAAATAAASHFGDNHPDTLLIRHTLALLTAAEGDLAAGLASLESLTALATAGFGAEHPLVIRLGAALRELRARRP